MRYLIGALRLMTSADSCHITRAVTGPDAARGPHA